MRIGFDGSCLANRRGFGRFARSLLRALASESRGHELVVVIDRPSLDSVEVPAGCEVVPVEVTEAPSRAASSTGRRRLQDMLAMGRAASRSRLDLMYFPATYSFFPVWNVGPVVVTMHDILPMKFPDLVFPSRKGRLAWALKEHLAARWADLVVTVSEASRRDLIEWFRLRETRVRVITEGPEPLFGPRPEGPVSDDALRRHGVDPRAPFLLYVGGLSPHKNLLRLIEAFSISGLEREGVRLVLVGDLGDVFHTHVPELRAAVARHGLGASVHLPGFVPDEDLVHLYNRAMALAQPSLMEGFGLPAVEAMACGCAVVASRAGSLLEVIGNAGLFFDPTDASAMAGALRQVVDDPGTRLALRREARARAPRFTWEASARTLLDALESMGPGSRGRAALLGPRARSSRPTTRHEAINLDSGRVSCRSRPSSRS